MTTFYLIRHGKSDTGCRWLSDEEAGRRVEEARRFGYSGPGGEILPWETAEQIHARVNAVLCRYRQNRKVAVVCHGLLMESFLGIPHPDNAEIAEYVMNE